ncbi:MAG: O-antigen ligase family protein [Rhizobiaceae bacterium]
MSTADINHDMIDPALRARAVNRLIMVLALGFGVLLSGYVLNEPAPYELYMTGMIAIWALFGLRLSRSNAPLLALFIIFNIGGLISMLQMPDLKEAPLYIAVSLFLAFTSVCYAAVIERDKSMLPVIFNAYLIAALFTSVLGIIGYFNLVPGADIFTLYGRARGGFQDPNVFGPFLMLPAAWLLHCVLKGRAAMMPIYFVGLLIISLGAFLSFSRAAWGMLIMVMALVAFFLFIGSNSTKFRLRVTLLAGAAFLFVVIALLVALQIPQVAELFSERARLVQDYDSARLGRFARYGLGLLLAMENPLGIGPLEFGPIYGEDTHNMWLKTLLDYSWLGFIAYVTLTCLTLGLGVRILFRNRPWQPFLTCAFSVYLAHLVIGNIIDTDPWRHFYMIIGIIWGCIGLEYRHGYKVKRAVRPRNLSD